MSKPIKPTFANNIGASNGDPLRNRSIRIAPDAVKLDSVWSANPISPTTISKSIATVCTMMSLGLGFSITPRNRQVVAPNRADTTGNQTHGLSN